MEMDGNIGAFGVQTAHDGGAETPGSSRHQGDATGQCAKGGGRHRDYVHRIGQGCNFYVRFREH